MRFVYDKHLPYYRAKSAQAVKDMVTSDYLGTPFSTEWLYAYQKGNEQEDNFYELSYIAGEEGPYLPKRHGSTWRNKFSGWAAEDTVSHHDKYIKFKALMYIY